MQYENVQLITSRPSQIAALRDFFASKNSEDLQNACGRLDILPDAHATNWRDVEYAFNHLFVGPMVVPAPPYASIYLEPEPQMMGRTTLEVRELYHELSLNAPNFNDGGVLPDDHLALELDAVLALLAVEEWCHGLDGPSGVETECRMHLAWLVDHMASWVPQFTEKVCHSTSNNSEKYVCDAVILGIINVLSSTIERLYASYGSTKFINDKRVYKEFNNER